jgi:hypothetical protein
VWDYLASRFFPLSSYLAVGIRSKSDPVDYFLSFVFATVEMADNQLDVDMSQERGAWSPHIGWRIGQG